MWAVVGPGEGTKYATCGDVAWHASRPLKTCLLPASIWTGKRGGTREGGEIDEEGRGGQQLGEGGGRNYALDLEEWRVHTHNVQSLSLNFKYI